MRKTSDITASGLKAKILELLDEHRVMSVATLRPDGWPQATMVGYIHDDLTLYFAVARVSQKYANIARDPRISIALGHDTPDRLRGLSMAGRAVEIMEVAEIVRLNALMLARYPEQAMFSPREASAALLRFAPIVISIIDLARGPGEPELVEVRAETSVSRISNRLPARHVKGGRSAPSDARRSEEVIVNYTHGGGHAYRPGAPF